MIGVVRRYQTSGISSEEVKKVKEDIKHCFTKLTCFLMPHPGEKVAGDPSFEGCLSDIKEDFKNQLRHLVPQLFSRENLVLKTIAGKPITCKQLFEFFKSYVEVYNNREEMPEPKGFFEATAEVQHRNAHDEAVDDYTQQMNKLTSEIPVPSQKRMDEVHASLRVEAIDKFRSSRKMGRRELSARYQSLLDKNLHELHEKYEMQRDVREERIKTELMEAATHVLKEYGEDMIEVMITVPLVTEEELQLEHEEKKNWAIQNFMKERGIASEDLFRKYEEKLEKDIDSQSTLYFTKRKWKENIADRDLLNAVQYTVWIYCTQMGRSCGGAIITEEELEENHMKYYKEALETFSQRTQITLCPYLLDGHHTRLIMRLDEVYKKYIDIRELNERQAETELMNAKEEAMEEYNGMMSKFLVDLMSEEKLNKMHANFRQQTTESFEETGEKYPHLAKKHTHDLEVRMSSEHERYKALRNSQELQAEAALQDAVERSMTLYELEMSCLCGGKGTADGGRQGPTDSHLLTVEELREGHEKYRWEALKVFWETGAQWQYLGVKYKEELEEGLMKAKEELEEKRKSKEKIVRRLLEKTVREKAEDYLSPTRMKNFYGENVVDKRELEKNHEEHRDAVVRSFMEDGDWAPSWLVEEYRAILETNLDVWHRSLEVNMAEERAKRYQEKNVFGLVGTLVPPVANSIIGPGAGGMALAAVGAAESIFPLVVWKSRWRNVAVLPDLSSIIMPLRGRAESLDPDVDEDAVRGCAICVVEHKEFDEKDSFLLKEDRLRRVLMQEHCRDKPVAVVSIAGGARRGKSFLLSLFLRYLRAQGSEDWLENENIPITGFAWKMSSKRVTTGIHIWDEIFALKLPNGEEACVLLMDTEGTFDCEESLAHSVTVFALSTLLSSVQIYNLKENINMDDLLHLQFFTGYGRLCLEESAEKPFQNFLFLVRDWMNKHEFSYGSEGGQMLLDEKLQTSGRQQEKVKKVKEDIKLCFSKLNCFLMPHPGEKVAGDPNFSGCLSDIKEDFKDQLCHLVPQLLSPENLVLKTIAGQPITCKQLFQYFKSYVGVYNNREETPEPKGFFEATAEVQHRNAHDEAVDRYSEQMKRLVTETPVPSERRLDEVHSSLRLEAIDKFTSSKKMGGKEILGIYQSLLDKNLCELHERYRMQRDAREERTKMELMEAAIGALKVYGEDMAEVMRTVPLVTGEEMRVEHEEKKTWAIQNFQLKRGIANEDLFRQHKEKLEKDIDTQSTIYFTERQWKEGTADRELFNAVQSTIWIYCTQMGHSCGGAVIPENELEREHWKYYEEALETFSQRTRDTLCPHLLDRHKDNLTRRLDEEYKKYVELRETKERQAETELMNAKEEAMEKYNDTMSKLLVNLMSEEKLNNMQANYRRQTIESFEETAEKYPHLAKKHMDDLEARMSSEHERYKAFRNSQELQAEAALHDAVERSVTHYELEMSCLCGGKDTADGGRQGRRLGGRLGATDSHLLTEKELLEGHEKHCKEALDIFWVTGKQWLHLAEKFKEELEERLTKAKDELEKKRKKKEERVRRLLEKSVREKAEEYFGPTRMKKFCGETVVNVGELKESHQEHRDAVVRSFVEEGDWAPDWLVEECRAILATVSALRFFLPSQSNTPLIRIYRQYLDAWYRSLETKMAEERSKRDQDKNVSNMVARVVSQMANAVLSPATAGMVNVALDAARDVIPQLVGNSRWRNEAVLPDPVGISMPLRVLEVNPALDEEHSGKEEPETSDEPE
ncbi:unnamed protein product [Darwinula stevensoni]|uniref:GB1/RHD3-type G domain-containing protein n=1 Tax=Darwinula stevensoni TaxID=69355 RepID=A0A7R8XBR5_9CRUS|nr:unnamed protein product [Darwinula stevensoni]CAG0891478.1 unnamed protein product [Darwinula stevensoni]